MKSTPSLPAAPIRTRLPRSPQIATSVVFVALSGLPLALFAASTPAPGSRTENSSVYSKPTSTYSAPAPSTYTPPKPVYQPPAPVYQPPAPVYQAPKPIYQPPAPSSSSSTYKPASSSSSASSKPTAYETMNAKLEADRVRQAEQTQKTIDSIRKSGEENARIGAEIVQNVNEYNAQREIKYQEDKARYEQSVEEGRQNSQRRREEELDREQARDAERAARLQENMQRQQEEQQRAEAERAIAAENARIQREADAQQQAVIRETLTRADQGVAARQYADVINGLKDWSAANPGQPAVEQAAKAKIAEVEKEYAAYRRRQQSNQKLASLLDTPAPANDTRRAPAPAPTSTPSAGSKSTVSQRLKSLVD